MTPPFAVDSNQHARLGQEAIRAEEPSRRVQLLEVAKRPIKALLRSPPRPFECGSNSSGGYAARCSGDGATRSSARVVDPDEYFAPGVSLLDITDCLRHFLERVRPVDHGLHLPGIGERRQCLQVRLDALGL